MINLFTKLLLAMLLTLSPMSVSLYAQEQGAPSKKDLPTSQDLEDLSEGLAQFTKAEFDKIYELLPVALPEQSRNRAISIYQEVLQAIARGGEHDPKDPHYPKTFEGKISAGHTVEGGEYEVAWIEGKPLIIVSLEEFRGKLVFLSENLDKKSKSFRRFLYHLHIFAGDNGFGIWDHLTAKESDSKKERIIKWIQHFKGRHFDRGADVYLMNINDQHQVTHSQLSKRPKWLTPKWFARYWQAMNLGRKMTMKKLITAIGIAAIPTTAASFFVNNEMAAIIAGYTIITQANYEAVLTYKFTHSEVMQMIKLGFLTAFNSLLYIGITQGTGATMGSIFHGLSNAALSIFLFHHWRLNKKLLLESGITVGNFKITSDFELKLPRFLAGKKLQIFNKTYQIPHSLKMKAPKKLKGEVEVAKAKVHDTVTDVIPGTGRQLQLAYEISPLIIVGLAYAGHGLAIIYNQYRKLKGIEDSPKLDRIMEKVFHQKFFKDTAKKIKATCSRWFQRGSHP